MTSKSLLILHRGIGIAAAAWLLSPTASLAANAGNGPKAQIFAKFDTNKNGKIDGEEIAAVRAAFAADVKGQFARYDANHDGKLDDSEIAEIKPPGSGGKKGDKAGTKASEETKSAEGSSAATEKPAP
jgi:hypothetical protein